MARYHNYKANLAILQQAPDQDLTNEFIQSGIINKFVMQFELSWRLLKGVLVHEGIAKTSISSPRKVIEAAHVTYEFIDENLWLGMLADRRQHEYAYDTALAESLVTTILESYLAAFERLLDELESLYGKEFLKTL